MLEKIQSTGFLAGVVLLATAGAMAHSHWLVPTSLAMLAGIILGFRIAGGLAPDRRLSIWAGPLRATQSPPQHLAGSRKAA